MTIAKPDLPRPDLSPHGEEALRAVSNHEARGPSFETPACGGLLRMRSPRIGLSEFEFQTAEQTRARDLMARLAPEFVHEVPSKKEGAGNAGCPLHP